MRAARERVSIDLSLLHAKVQASAPRDRQLLFDIEFAVYTVLHLFAVNLALFHTALYNYHWSLLVFNLCFLTRHVLWSLQRYVSIRDPLRKTEFGLAVWFLRATTVLTIIYCLSKFLYHISVPMVLFIVFWLLTQYFNPGENKDRYLNGSVDAYMCCRNLMLRIAEVTLCGSVLPYQLIARPGAYIDVGNYLITILSLLCAGVSIVSSELLRKRSLELNSYLRSIGSWEAVCATRHVVEDWKPDRSYNKGEMVRHGNQTWKALGKVTTMCEPGKHESSLLYRVFNNPSESLFTVKCATALAILVHLYCLLYRPYAASCCLSFACLLYAGIRSQLISKAVTETKDS